MTYTDDDVFQAAKRLGTRLAPLGGESNTMDMLGEALPGVSEMMRGRLIWVFLRASDERDMDRMQLITFAFLAGLQLANELRDMAEARTNYGGEEIPS